MNAQDHTGKLPVELLSMIFNELCLDDILKCSHVSRGWRGVARRHPFYWRDIKLASLSTTALDFFHDRLDSGADRIISVCIYLPEVSFPVRLRSIVLPAIVNNMDRICNLAAKFPLHFDSDVFGILRTPAPRLKLLDVYVVDAMKASTAFPSELFANHAPKFACLRLYNVRLAPPHLPQAIRRLESMQYYASNEQAFPTALLSHCTELKKLSIFGRFSPITPSAMHGYIPAERRLQTLEVGVFSGSLDILQSFPCASIPHVSIPMYRDAAADLLLGHLCGALQLRLECKDGMLFLEYASATGLRRTFIYPHPDIATLTIPEPYTTDDLLSRVQSVAVSSDCVHLLASLRALPACARIAVLAAAGHPLVPPTAAVALPKLETLELECEPEYSDVDARAFFDAMVAQSKNSVRVCLMDGRGRRQLCVAPPPEPCARQV